MGHHTKGQGRWAALALIATLVLTLAFASQALAGPPVHLRKPKLDIAGLNHACGTAVDNKGDLYASSAGEGKIKVYGPADHTTPIAEIANANEPCALAVNTRGELLVSEQATGNVVVYAPDEYPLAATPTYSAPITVDASGEAKGISIDPFDDRLYVAEGDHVSAYASERQQLAISNATGGTYKLRFEGEETAPLPYNATNGEIEAALEALAAIGPGGVSVSGSAVSFTGPLAYRDVPQLETLSSLEGNEIQKVTVKATGGTYKLRFEGLETAAIKFNATALELKSTLNSLATIGAVGGSVSVSGGPGDEGGTSPYEVTFEGALGNRNVRPIESAQSGLGGGSTSVSTVKNGAEWLATTVRSGGLGVDEAQPLSVSSATGGTFKLKFDTEETASIAYDAPARKAEGPGSVEEALEELGAIGAGGASVNYGETPSFLNRFYKVEFSGALAHKDVPQLEILPSLQGNEIQRVTVQATAGTYTLTATTGQGTGEVTSGSKAVKGLKASLGAFRIGDAISGPGIPEGTTIAAVGAGTLELSKEATASFKGVSLSASETTAAIEYKASAAKLKEALEALAGIDPGDVAVSGGPGDEKGTSPYFIAFEGAYAARNVAQMTSASAGLSGTVSTATAVNGASTSASTEPQGFSGILGEGSLGEATGVAAFTYEDFSESIDHRLYLGVADAQGDVLRTFSGRGIDSLKQRRTITGVDADEDGEVSAEEHFGFGSGGAYLAADPGNANPKSPYDCLQVGGQACTAGHLYLYDAAQEAVDELDATGHFLDQLRAPGLGDGGPSQVAVERSGGAGDGTVYASAGEGTGARLVAFAPLGQPQRAQLEPPLSRKLASAQSVAVDSHGDVYVGAASKVIVFDPAGSELTSFAGSTMVDLAVDSAGNVYAVEETKAGKQLSYYHPAAYPPKKETAYTQSAKLAEGSLVGVAVDPTDDRPYLYEVNAKFTGAILVFKAVAAGSGLEETCGEGLNLPGGSARDVEVDGATGEVVVGANITRVTAIRCGAEKETVRQIKGNGCPGGKIDPNPSLAVDQASGHVVALEPGQAGGAHEYEAAGGCVAQFGSFSSQSAPQSRVAIDSSCALHDPPLSEHTTPTCKTFDPANGNTYVAYDALNNTAQPYDVNAFGPLSYPAAGKRKLTLEKTGKGVGKVSSAPAGIDCGSTCTAEFEATQIVTLVAKAEAGSKLVGWSGCEAEEAISATEGVCEVIASEDTKVTAAFEPTVSGAEYPLTVTREGTGAGEVTSSPAGIKCGSTCTADFVEGFNVLLQAKADPGSEVAKWTGCQSEPSQTECEVTMSAAKEVKVEIGPEHPLLTVSLKGAGTGEVTSAPAGISCPGTCAAKFNLGQGVTLTAKASPGSKLTGWSGCDAEPTPGECKATLSAPRAVTATFGALPQVKAITPNPIGYDEATLRGEVDPKGLATSYRFQYLTQAEYEAAGNGFKGAQETPVGKLEAGEGPLAVQAPLVGLAEGTAYRFRLIAANAVGEASAEGPAFETLVRGEAQDCPNAEYRSGPSSFLPDCRAYELVTPAEVRGAVTAFGSQEPFNSWFVAPRGAGAGESIAFAAEVPRSEGLAFRAARGAGAHPPGGWSSEPYTFTYAQGAAGARGVSADQRYWSYRTSIARSFPAGEYLRVPAGTASGMCLPEPKASFEAADPEAKFELTGCGALGADPSAVGHFVSAGGAHAIFSSKAHLEAGAPAAGTEAIYDREVGSAEAEVVSTKPGGGAFAGGEAPEYVATGEDGESVLFRAGGALYLHREGKTVEVAASPNTYAGISEDGARVFYAASAESQPAAGLRACDVAAGPCAGAGAHAPVQIAANAVFVNVAGEGGGALFTAEEALTGSEANDNGEVAKAGKANLYAWEEGSVRFVAILDPQDLVAFRTALEDENAEVGLENLLAWTNAVKGQVGSNGIGGRAYSPTRSTPDGSAFVFQSHARLSGYDNEGVGEIYRYAPGAAAGERLLCVSCPPGGAPPASVADTFLQTFNAQHIDSFDPRRIGATTEITLIPNLTEDGRKVFFQSFDPLVPEDANHAQDVYEWRAQGTVGPGGDECRRKGGCLALISTGQGEAMSFLYGMDADGKNVFFETQEQLVGADIPGTFSLYDAREGGGIPERPEAAPCVGDSCQGEGAPPPALPAPASGGAGGGNVEEPVSRRPCGKGKRRVKGRCVKVKRHRKHRKRAHRRRAHRKGGAGR